MPSPLSSMVRTQGSDHGYVPHSELVAARSVLAGKVSVFVFIVARDLRLLIRPVVVHQMGQIEFTPKPSSSIIECP